MLQGDADIVECLGKVDVGRLNGKGSVGDGRSLDDIVDEALEHVARVTDDAHVLAAVWGIAKGFEDTRKAYDGVQRRAQFVGHGSHETALLSDAVIGVLSQLLQLQTGVMEQGDVGGDAFVPRYLPMLIHDRLEGDAEHFVGVALGLLAHVDDKVLRLADDGIIDGLEERFLVLFFQGLGDMGKRIDKLGFRR